MERKSILGIIALAVLWLLVSVSASAQSGVVVINPGDDARAIVDRHPAGTTFLFRAGVHRMTSTIEPRRGDVFDGEVGAVLNGARVLSGFEREGNLWVIKGQTQQGPRTNATHGYEVCDAQHPRCEYPEELFVDGVPLLHVDNKSKVAAGKWFFDYGNDRIYMADDPNGRLVETAVTTYAFLGSGQDNVTIRNLTIEKYASPTQQGTIQARGTTGWLIENVTSQWNHGAGISTDTAMRVINSRFNYNGHLGIHGRGDNLLIEGNEIAYNNWAGHDLEWEAGGTKFSRTDGLVVRNNYVHHNQGVGLWTDIDNINVLYEGNLVTHNLRFGLFHEISYAAIIRNNTLEYNNYQRYGGQIYISNSSDVEIYGNQVVVGDKLGDSIVIFHKERGVGAHGPWLSRNINVYNNTVVFTAGTGWAGSTLHYQTPGRWDNSTNKFDGNTYYLSDADFQHWSWGRDKLKWSQFRERGQERNGKMIATTLPELSNLTVTGSLNQAPVRPGYSWRHANNENNGPAAPWYHVTVRKGGQVLLDQWYEAALICQGVNCSVNPGVELTSAGDYLLTVQAWSEATGYGVNEDYSFTVNLPTPGNTQNMTVSTDSMGRPRITWREDTAVSWYQIYVGTADLSQQMYLEWHEKTGDLCTNGTCTLTLNIYPTNGDYAVYMQSWGPGGFSPDWAGPANFSLTQPTPEVPGTLQVDNPNSTRPQFSWKGVAGATFYQLWIGTPGPDFVTQYQGWYSAAEMGCEDLSFCNVVPNTDLPTGGEYVWYVQAWGPGGFSTGGVSGWAEGRTVLNP